MKEIAPKQRNAYNWLTHARDYQHGAANADNMQAAADAWRDTLAALMQSEFTHDHEEYEHPGAPGSWYCTQCGQKSNWVEEHKFEFSQWQAAADKELKGE
jgi:hypothetical protein